MKAAAGGPSERKILSFRSACARYALSVSKKSAAIAARIEAYRGLDLPAHYLAYFACFNDRLYYEAHDVLEELWLPLRKDSTGDFYKGLIQLAGAFVHLQKGRASPSAALFRLARANLEKFPRQHQGLDLAATLQLAEEWLGRLEAGEAGNGLLDRYPAPELKSPAANR